MLDTGRYVITNVRYGNKVVLHDPDDGSCLVSESHPTAITGEKWDVILLNNGHYTIKNHDYGSFANSLAMTLDEESPFGGSKHQQWQIREWKTGQYIIFPTGVHRAFWGLQDLDLNTPITFGSFPNNPKYQWVFTQVSDDTGPNVGTSQPSTSRVVAETCPSSPARDDGEELEKAAKAELVKKASEMQDMVPHEKGHRKLTEPQEKKDPPPPRASPQQPRRKPRREREKREDKESQANQEKKYREEQDRMARLVRQAMEKREREQREKIERQVQLELERRLREEKERIEQLVQLEVKMRRQEEQERVALREMKREVQQWRERELEQEERERLASAQHFSTSSQDDSVMKAQKISLGDDLATFTTIISPWTKPREWLLTNEKSVDSIVERIISFTEISESQSTILSRNGDRIFLRLTVFLLAHSMLCANDKNHLRNIEDKLNEWQNWDLITMLENHQLMQEYLLEQSKHSLQSCTNSHPETLLKDLLALDAIGLAVHLTLVLTDDAQYKVILTRRGSQAQALLDLLQARLDYAIDPTYKPRHVKGLIKLSRASRLYPQCLVVTDVEMDPIAIASGGFADVHKGRLHGHQIAVKVLRIYESSDMAKLLKEFSSEAATWRQLSHPNVLPFYGVFHLGVSLRKLCLICPWMENANVVKFLASVAPHTNCVLLALDIASGLEYLHREKVIHGDLKGLNILISPSRRAILADFGLATSVDSNPAMLTILSTTNKKMGTLRWQAPELFPDFHNVATSTSADDHPDQRNTYATDVYAFALVCYEMFSGEFPFHNILSDIHVMFAVQQGRRPPRPVHSLATTRGLDDDIWHFIEACWDTEPPKRPTASQIVQRLQELPARPMDNRPCDNLNISFPSRALYHEAGHPFSYLESGIDRCK